MKYRVGLTWIEAGHVEVEANTHEEAREAALSIVSLDSYDRTGYVDDSLLVYTTEPVDNPLDCEEWD